MGRWGDGEMLSHNAIKKYNLNAQQLFNTLELLQKYKAPHPNPLAGVGFLQLGGITNKKGIHRSLREAAPTLKMNGSIVE
jgi:hypothetical protein